MRILNAFGFRLTAIEALDVRASVGEDYERKEAALTRKVTMTEWMKDAPWWVSQRLERMSRWRGVAWSSGSDEPDWAHDGRQPAPNLAGAEAVGSMVRDSTEDDLESHHIIALDLDHGAITIPSSTEGHVHLIINSVVPWSKYVQLLELLAEMNVIEPGFVAASKKRGETFLRLPWVRKGKERFDAEAALSEWLEDSVAEG